MNIKVGDQAPDFSLPDQNGVVRKLSDFRGSWVLLYFYPKDMSPGCTKEACSIGEQFPSFEKLGTVVLGVSADSVASHKKFEEKYKLPFTLLSDEKHEVLEKYGVWQKKSFLGKSYMGTDRSSLLIDFDGKVVRVYERVKPSDHAEEVLKDIEDMKK
jgi:peroxiredoxin Q/BCP